MSFCVVTGTQMIMFTGSCRGVCISLGVTVSVTVHMCGCGCVWKGFVWVCGTGCWGAPRGSICVAQCVSLCLPTRTSVSLCLTELGSVSSRVPVCVLSPLQLLDQELKHELLAHYPAAHSLCHWGEWQCGGGPGVCWREEWGE